MKKKICKKCKIFVEGSECPLCKGNQFATTYQGRINVTNHNKSEIAKKMDFTANGEYVIKYR